MLKYYQLNYVLLLIIVSIFVKTVLYVLMNIRYMFLKLDSNFLKHLVDGTLK